MTEQIQLSDFQRRLLEVPEQIDVALTGGRGGGKSYALALLALRALEQYRSRSRVLYIRQTYKGLGDFELLTRELFGRIYGSAARYNAAEHVWRLPSGGYLELAQLETYSDFFKFQGRSFTLLLVDEAGQYASGSLIDLLRSNLRGPRDVPSRMALAANPGGPGHHWIAKRYVLTRTPWAAYQEPHSGHVWVTAPSTFRANDFIDREQYFAQLRSACAHDPELLRAWTEGDWAIARGAFFASVLDENRNAVEPWDEVPTRHSGRPWETFLAHDFGVSAPSVTYIVALSPGATGSDGRFYPRGSLILLDELSTALPDEPSKGCGWTVPILGEAITDMCRRWDVDARGCADDAIFARNGTGAGTIAAEFARVGVYFYPARKADRISGWTTMARLLADAGKPDVPGLYISRRCSYFWQTVPFLARDAKRVEDVDSRGPDHAADATRYGCLWEGGRIQRIKLSGV